MKNSKNHASNVASSSGPIYFFGGIGALIYYIQVAHGFWGVVLAFLKSIVWPALLTYDLLKFLAR